MIFVHRVINYGRDYNMFTEDKGAIWAHMASDTSDEELIAFGRRIGLKASWLQRAGTEYAHFDITRHKVEQAQHAGARLVSVKDFARYAVQARREAMRATKNQT